MYRSTLLLIIMLPALLFGNLRPDIAPGSIIIKPEEQNIQQLKVLCENYGIELKNIAPKCDLLLGLFSLKTSETDITKAKKFGDISRLMKFYQDEKEYIYSRVELIQKSGLVKYAQPNHILHSSFTPNDPYFIDDEDYSLSSDPDQYGMFIMNAQEGWDVTRGDPSVIIAILDSGVDLDHPDLLDNIWVNPEEDINGNNLPYDLDDLDEFDNDGNGYVDDINGYDFGGAQTGAFMDPVDVSSEDWNPDIHIWDKGWGEPDPSVGDGLDLLGMNSGLFPADMGVSHGTHCAGIAAAKINNGMYFAGVAGECKIMAVRVMTPEGTTNESDLIAGIRYAVDNGANVLSMSFGDLGFSSVPEGLRESIEYAYNHNVVLIAASGNNGNEGLAFPASSPYTLSVGSFNSSRQRSSFSQYGAELDVLAAGGDATNDGVYTEGIWSTWVASFAEERDSGLVAGGHYIKPTAGTSMACPHAAGLAGLILSIDPTLSNDSLYNIIRNTAQDIGSAGWDSQTGFGIIDIGAALRATNIKTDVALSKKMNLFPYPNPFNAEVTIPVIMDKSGIIEMDIYNIIGEKVESKNYQLNKGSHTLRWVPPTSSASSGLYYITLRTESNSWTEKVLFIK